MTILQALILGLVQGLTEYIPVSSTAHLILVPWLLGWQFDPQTVFVFNILVQWGTLAGVVAYFWRDIWAIAVGVLGGLRRRQPFDTPEARLGWFVVMATLPAVVVGFFLKPIMEQLYQLYTLIAGVMMLAGVLMLAAEHWGKRRRALSSMTALDAFIIGAWQVLAFIPGVSRSSATVSGGLLRHFMRADAARFSFLMSIPALLGAGVIALTDLLDNPQLVAALAGPLAAGFLAALISGYVSIRWLLGYLKTRSFNAFIVYRLIFGALCILVGLTRG